MTYDPTRLTLGKLLASQDATIARNAMSVLKVIQKCDHKDELGACIYCFKPAHRHDWDAHGKCGQCKMWKHEVEEAQEDIT